MGGLPILYDTGIATYIWVLSNKKTGTKREGKVQLINANGLYKKRRKALGNKRNDIPESAIAEITRLYGDFAESEISKIFDNSDFGYIKITVERPLRLNFAVSEDRIEYLTNPQTIPDLFDDLRDPEERNGEEYSPVAFKIVKALRTMDQNKVWYDENEFRNVLSQALTNSRIPDNKYAVEHLVRSLSVADPNAPIYLKRGKPQPDTTLRDTENVPLKEDIQTYFEREVLPFAPDAWIDEKKSKVGYEIPFTRYFYKYEAPKPSAEIMQEILSIEAELDGALAEVFGV